jgi:cytochrome c1
LKDPALVKSDTQMPNLNLAEDEIEALIAFINSK